MLLTSRQSGGTETVQSVESIADNIEVLRRILAKQQQREIGHGEAQEIGDSLIEFYEVLAEEVQDAPAS